MRRGLFFCVLVTIGGSVAGCGSPPAADEGVLRVALSREPATWNRLLAADYPTHVVTDQLHAPLIRLNHETQQMEPALAESWEFSEDGRELVFYLRDGVRFSDGEPFTADDVAFTFRVLHDPGVLSQLKDSAMIDGENIVAHVIDETTVGFRLPRRTAAVERIFDSIRILPEHRLAESLAAGTLAADTGLGAPIENIVGLGAFRLREHVPGQRIVLERNPHYFRSGDDEYPRLVGNGFRRRTGHERASSQAPRRRPMLPCACGQSARYAGRHGKNFESALGLLRLERAYYQLRAVRGGLLSARPGTGLGGWLALSGRVAHGRTGGRHGQL